MPPTPTSRLAASLGSLAIAATLLPTTACKPGRNAAGVIANTPSAADGMGQQKCGVKQSATKPLIIEWPGAERAALEGRAARGLVPVRYSGCEMEILTSCTVVDLQYEYLGLTPRRETVRIKDFDELYANLPIGAVKLETKLERSGQLNVDMMIAGRLEAPPRDKYTEYDLEGVEAQCKTATHVITGITVGAFEFSSGAGAEIGGGAEVSGVAGAGAKSASEKEFLSSGGDMSACGGSEPGATEAPGHCREMLRVEVVEISRVQNAAAASGTSASNAGVLGLRDSKPKDDGTPATGWTPELERKRKVWAGLAYVGAGAFVLGGVAALTGLLMGTRAKTKLGELGLDTTTQPGSDSTPADTSDERTSTIRQYQIATPMATIGYVTLAVGGILATIALPTAQKLKKQKQALEARVIPSASPFGGGATVEVKF